MGLVEKQMESSGVTPEELKEVLYVVKLGISQAQGTLCDCEECRNNKDREEKLIELMKKKIELNLVDDKVKEGFYEALKKRNEGNELAKTLISFFDKMKFMMTDEDLKDINNRADEMNKTISESKNGLFNRLFGKD